MQRIHESIPTKSTPMRNELIPIPARGERIEVSVCDAQRTGPTFSSFLLDCLARVDEIHSNTLDPIAEAN
jgi:hypothetical protein